MKKKFLAVVMAMAISLTGLTGLTVSTFAAETYEHTAKVNVVDTLDSTNLMSETIAFDWPTEHVDDIHKVNFTLTNPSYVKVVVNSTVQYENLDSISGLAQAYICTPSGIKVGSGIGSHLSEIWANKPETNYYVLEAGNYSIVFPGKSKDNTYNRASSGTVTTMIEAVPVNRTENKLGNTIANAIPLSNGVTSTGLISTTTGVQYFKLTLPKKSEVKFDMSINAPEYFEYNNAEYSLIDSKNLDITSLITKPKYIWDTKREDTDKYIIGTQDRVAYDHFYPTAQTTNVITLNAGTYYLKFAKVDDPTTINVKTSIKEVLTLKAQKITTAKIKTYKVSALKKKAAKINLKAKTNGKGKLTYKVTSTPKGMKKFISVSKKGVVTIKKKAKKGSYKITITAAAKGGYKKTTKTITIKVK